MNKINLNEEIKNWNSNEARRLIILSNRSFDEVDFSDGCYKKDVSGDCTLKFAPSFLRDFLKGRNSSNQPKYEICLSGFFFDCHFYFSPNEWILLDRKQLREYFKEQNEKNTLKISKGEYRILSREELTKFFTSGEQQKFSAIAKEIEEKTRNLNLSNSHREIIFKDNFKFYIESCGSSINAWGTCYCDFPVCVPQCPDFVTQALFHIENCFEKVEDAENFKDVFFAGCSKVNSGGKETISNFPISSPENLSHSPQISQIIRKGEKLQSDYPSFELRKNLDKLQEKLFEINPVKARQTIIDVIEDKIKTVQSQWGIILSQEARCLN